MAGKRRSASKPKSPRGAVAEAELRIIGGTFRGRLLRHAGDPRTRPMKNRVREAVFNLLGPAVKQKHVIDLFAGTGALGLEALSRGSETATLIERHFPTARIIEENVARLGVEGRAEVIAADAFGWVQRHLPPQGRPWLVFCSPPYDFYVQRAAEMAELLETIARRAPDGSLLAVEADRRFEPARLPDWLEWDVRHYPPAVVAIAEVWHHG